MTDISPYTLASIILSLAVLIGYINHRFIKMQSTIAIMSGSMLLSFALLLLKHLPFNEIANHLVKVVSHTDFKDVLLKGMLSFLLFAGSLSIDFNLLKSHKWEIGTLASLSTIVSAFLIGLLAYYLLPLIHLKLPLIYCLLFGALISPTDPIAVLATFKEVGAPKQLEVCVAGESLFNDGVGIVIFLTLFTLAFDKSHQVSAMSVALLFIRQTLGGIAYGLLIGWLANLLIKSVCDTTIIILITLAVVTGGYDLAMALNISGPLAMVVAGIVAGNSSHITQENHSYHVLKIFWELIDEILNAMLFLLIGFELLALHASWRSVCAGLLAIPLVLLVRFLTVAIPMGLLPFKLKHQRYSIRILTWGGLRGALAVALALSLPPSQARDTILVITYAIVAFAVIIQGLSIKSLAAKATQAHQLKHTNP